MKQSFLLISLFSLLACRTKQAATETTEPALPADQVTLSQAEIRNAGIITGTVRTGPAQHTLKVSGLVDVPPQNIVSISFPTGGYLKSTRLLPGMRVRRGQVLAEMQDGSLIQLQQDYLLARSKAAFLQKEYARQKLLNADKTASDKIVEQTQSEYQQQRILAAGYGERLRLAGINPAILNEGTIRRSVTIPSPIDGYVSAVKVNIGKYVNPSDVLFELVNPDDLHLSLKVFEKDITSIRKGQKIRVRLVNQPAAVYQAEVSLINRNVDTDRSAEVHCHFLNADERLLPGMFADAEIAVETSEAELLPEEAVVRWGNAQYVFLETGTGRYRMVPVTVSPAGDGWLRLVAPPKELLKGLVVTKNAYAVLMKMKNTAE